MNLSKFLDNWAKQHPTYDPAQDHNNPKKEKQVVDWLIEGGEPPLPLWPKLKGKK